MNGNSSQPSANNATTADIKNNMWNDWKFAVVLWGKMPFYKITIDSFW